MVTVMIAEDDVVIAEMVEFALVESGYAVCGIARTVDEAVAIGRKHRPQLAIIDLNLADGQKGTRIRQDLGRDVPCGVLYATASAIEPLTGADGHAALAKPYRCSDLLRGLEIVAGMMETGSAAPPYPRGFTLLS